MSNGLAEFNNRDRIMVNCMLAYGFVMVLNMILSIAALVMALAPLTSPTPPQQPVENRINNPLPGLPEPKANAVQIEFGGKQ